MQIQLLAVESWYLLKRANIPLKCRSFVNQATVELNHCEIYIGRSGCWKPDAFLNVVTLNFEIAMSVKHGEFSLAFLGHTCGCLPTVPLMCCDVDCC